MGIQNTIPLSQTIQWASFLSGNRPLTLQSTSDPALTCANMIVEAIISPPFKWAWNRASIQFQTVDTLPWSENFIYPLGYRLIDYNGNMQTVTVAGTSGANPPIWSIVPGGTTVDNSITWTESNASDYLQNVPSFGTIELATLTDGNGKIWDIPNKTLTLTRNADKGRWQSIAPYLDDNNGNITFRASPGLPDALYTCSVQYQKRSVPMTGTSDLWPIPDMYSYIYSTGFLGMIWLFSDDARAGFMLQRFAAMVISIAEGLTEQEKNSFLDQWDVTIASRRAATRANQGITARAAS